MISFMIRRLYESDFDNIFKIFNSNSKFQDGLKSDSLIPTIDELWFSAHSNRIKNKDFVYVGYFKDDTLIAFIQGEMWLRNNIKVASIGWTLRDKNYSLTKSHRQTYWSDEILSIENALIDIFLEHQIKNIYCTVAVDSNSSSDIPGSRLSMFKRSIIEYVKAGRRCTDPDLCNHIYGNLVLNKDQELVEYTI